MNKNLMTTTGLIVAGALFLTLNILAGTALRTARFDLTENELYTLSDGTRSVLTELDEEVTLRFYFSKTLAQEIPAIQAYGKRVQELLEEFATISDKVTLIVDEPEPFSEAEDRAVSFGLRGAPANRSGDSLYFGLAATNTTDDTETIPFFSDAREEFLEYDLTQLIYKLGEPERPVVALITQLPLAGAPSNPMMQQPPAQPWVIYEQLAKLFDLRNLPWDTRTIDEDVDVLVVAHPKNLPESTLYAIDQFVLRGGHALVFVDPFCEIDAPPTDPQNPMASLQVPRGSNLQSLLPAWGVDFSTEDTLGDRARALEVRTASGAPSPFVVWAGLRADKEDFSADDAVTAQLKLMHIASGGILTQAAGATTEFSPLLVSSLEAGRIESQTLAFQQIAPDPAGMLDNLSVEGERLTIAARISGLTESAYPAGDPLASDAAEGEEAADEEGLPPHLAKSEGPINVIVVADVDMLTDRFWVRVQNFLGTRLVSPIADNGDFVVNAVENLTGSDDLIKLRSRGRFQRPFDRVIELRRDAEARYRAEEKELQAKLSDTERKLADLQQGKEGVETLILSDEQRDELERFREEQVSTRKELRQVRLQLNQDIESLGTGLKLGNILGVPLAVMLFGFASFALRSNKKKR
jgi:ABC-type uncharacterized transport system involved in gliding motility auxiliary subunit